MENYENIRILGKGSYGKVYLMREKTSKHLVCMKVVKLKNLPERERNACHGEVQLMRKLKHPNIVAYRDSFLTPQRESLCIVMTYCDGGDLCQMIEEAKGTRFTESKVLSFLVQMSLGLHFMHQQRVLHRDLKTRNVFLLSDGRVVLGDLGISKVLDGTQDFARTCIGTPYYMSPELFKHQPYSYKSDVWALGCILYEMMTLKHAFDAQSLNGLAMKIMRGRYPPVWSGYSRQLRDLVDSMLNVDPARRPSVPDILCRPFVRRHVYDIYQDLSSRCLADTVSFCESPSDISVDAQQLDALRAQLEALGLKNLLSRAQGGEVNSSNPVTAKSFRSTSRDHKSALERERERKVAVQAALDKLKKEREERMQRRQAREKRTTAKDRPAYSIASASPSRVRAPSAPKSSPILGVRGTAFTPPPLSGRRAPNTPLPSGVIRAPTPQKSNALEEPRMVQDLDLWTPKKAQPMDEHRLDSLNIAAAAEEKNDCDARRELTVADSVPPRSQPPLGIARPPLSTGATVQRLKYSAGPFALNIQQQEPQKGQDEVSLSSGSKLQQRQRRSFVVMDANSPPPLPGQVAQGFPQIPSVSGPKSSPEPARRSWIVHEIAPIIGPGVTDFVDENKTAVESGGPENESDRSANDDSDEDIKAFIDHNKIVSDDEDIERKELELKQSRCLDLQRSLETENKNTLEELGLEGEPDEADGSESKIEVSPPLQEPLQDLESPHNGRLGDRIANIQKKCIEALGEEKFLAAYKLLKDASDQDAFSVIDQIDNDDRSTSEVLQLLGDEHSEYLSMIDQLIFMEDAHFN